MTCHLINKAVMKRHEIGHVVSGSVTGGGPEFTQIRTPSQAIASK